MPKKETNKKQSHSKTATKKPLLSTSKKVGIAIYFTFMATLALVLGAQILLNNTFNQNSVSTSPTLYSPQTETTEEYDTANNTNRDSKSPDNYNSPKQNSNNSTIVDENSSTLNDEFDPAFYTQNNNNVSSTTPTSNNRINEF